MLGLKRKKLELPTPEEALPGRTDRQMRVADQHTVLGHPLKGPWPDGIETALFGLGCFWGAERKFWQQPGVYSTAVGYLGGHTPNATYEEVCSGMTGHNEVVLVAYDPKVISYGQLLKVFFESHDPTQGMRQGGDIGTQYRSGIYTLNDEQAVAANEAKATYGAALRAKGFDAITTEVLPAPDFFYAEDYHQQYLDKDPQGYCGLGGTGVACQIGTGVAAE
ncbi:Peptide methionine sulfoxide reductase MsrA [Alphaproteobacteria bacterium SO-S41]|nr:Peptide methionine sulfoxide reductase MsrA [Alphaproteobacteria bacterium SO-S41]